MYDSEKLRSAQAEVYQKGTVRPAVDFPVISLFSYVDVGSAGLAAGGRWRANLEATPLTATNRLAIACIIPCSWECLSETGSHQTPSTANNKVPREGAFLLAKVRR